MSGSGYASARNLPIALRGGVAIRRRHRARKGAAEGSQGIVALKKGDAKGAIKAAINLIPVPGLKEAFGIASKLFG